jgi:hypothetical protein
MDIVTDPSTNRAPDLPAPHVPAPTAPAPYPPSPYAPFPYAPPPPRGLPPAAIAAFVILGVVILVLGGALAITLTRTSGNGSSAPQTTTPALPQTTTPALPQTTGPEPTLFMVRGTVTYYSDNGSCVGTGYNTDIHNGTPVAVYDSTGKTVGTGTLYDGQSELSQFCVFQYEVDDVPGNIGPYTFQITDRKKWPFDESDPSVDIEIGGP